METEEEQRILPPIWVPLAFCAYALWHLSVNANRALLAWQQWHSATTGQFPHEHEYRFWQSSSSVTFAVLLPLPLLMYRVSPRARWALYVLWLALMAGTIVLDRRAQALSPY